MGDDAVPDSVTGNRRRRVVVRHGNTGRVIERRDPHKEFSRRVIAMHQVILTRTSPMEMCSCGCVARLCPVLNAAHELLGHPVPWE